MYSIVFSIQKSSREMCIGIGPYCNHRWPHLWKEFKKLQKQFEEKKMDWNSLAWFFLPWYHKAPFIESLINGWIIALYNTELRLGLLSSPSSWGSAPHKSSGSCGIHASTIVPPQLDSISPKTYINQSCPKWYTYVETWTLAPNIFSNYVQFFWRYICYIFRR